MKSIKPGRGPSFMGGVMSIFVSLFGLLWTYFVASSGGGIFSVFGLIFVAIGIFQAVMNFKNASSPNRYSMYDITDDDEESDPLNDRFGYNDNVKNSPSETKNSSADNSKAVLNNSEKSGGESRFCPYCGAETEKDFAYCNKCGKKLP